MSLVSSSALVTKNMTKGSQNCIGLGDLKDVGGVGDKAIVLDEERGSFY